MAAELIFAPEAEQDISKAYGWYEDRRADLGEEFLSCVDACIEAIRRTPEMHAIVYGNYRRGWFVAFLIQFFMSMQKTESSSTLYSTPPAIQRSGVNAFPDDG